jgi:flagellar biosynthesis/type III secretory pathway protein FliH
MSSSPSRAPLRPAQEKSASGKSLEVRPFPYSEALARAGQHDFPPGEQALRGRAALDPLAAAALDVEHEARLREMGRQQGALELRAKFDEQLAAERATLARALADFSRDRAAYYRKIEEEAVQLALAIARKVIHREAQVDPVLLMGIVRVALERIEGATGVALLVHPPQAAEWRQYLAAHLNPGDLPEIVEDPAIAPQQCVLRTSMGAADLGLEVQLKEIEKGLMDLLAARPQGKS